MRPLVKRILPWASAAALIYTVAFLAVALRSEERHLGFHQPKRFCGFYLDCHRMVEVAEVALTDRIGNQAPRGTYWIVTVRYGSDAYGVDMRMGGLAARVRTADGRWHDRDGAAEQRLAADGASTGLPGVTVPGGQHFDTRLVFDLPPDAEPLLRVRDNFMASRLAEAFLIGDEDSFLHHRTLFALSPDAPTATIGNLSLSVIAVERDTAAGAPYPVPADGVFYVVTLDVTGSGRFEARMVDRDGTSWSRAVDVEARLPAGPSGTTRMVFDVADRVVAPVLEIRPAGRLRAPIRIPLS